MPNKNRTKGLYHEKKIVDWLNGIGITAKKQPLSGALGGEYSGDIVINHKDHRLIAEVKYRDASNFPSPFSVLSNRDLAIYKRRKGDPQMIVILTIETFLKLMENSNGVAEPSDP
jgi:hypothetical protein